LPSKKVKRFTRCRSVTRPPQVEPSFGASHDRDKAVIQSTGDNTIKHHYLTLTLSTIIMIILTVSTIIITILLLTLSIIITHYQSRYPNHINVIILTLSTSSYQQYERHHTNPINVIILTLSTSS
jgi:hypothetical protein